MIVRKNLNFEMPGARQIFFEKNARVAKSRLGFPLSLFQALVELRFAADDAHAAAAAAHRGLHDDGIADRGREFSRFRGGVDRFLRPRKDRYASRVREASCGGFVSEEFEQFGSWADEGDACYLASAGECWILG